METSQISAEGRGRPGQTTVYVSGMRSNPVGDLATQTQQVVDRQCLVPKASIRSPCDFNEVMFVDPCALSKAAEQDEEQVMVVQGCCHSCNTSGLSTSSRNGISVSVSCEA